MGDVSIKIENVKKRYRLGAIGGGTLQGDLQSWWARKRGKEDPNSKIGQDVYQKNEIFWALKGINLEIYQGEALGIIGANGAGKSTLLKILSRVTAPTEGTVKIRGRISSMLEVGTGFHGELTGRENIYLNGAILGMSRTEVNQKIEQIIDFSECREFIDTPVKRYSSGMYVKLAFAVAAHLDAEIMIMDEVLAVGDMKFQEKCLSKMVDIARNEGRTILYVSHNMNTIRQLCSRCICLEKGNIFYDGPVEQAIKLYMGNVRKSEPYFEFDQDAQVESSDGRCLVLVSLKANEQENTVFNLADKIGFDLKIRGLRNETNMYLRLVIRYADGSPIAMVTSENTFSCNEGKEAVVKFLLDLNSLAPGQYAMQLLISKINAYGTFENCGGTDKSFENAFCFEIAGSDKFNKNIEWLHKYWGHTYLKPMMLEEEQNK